ncbi:hypothetical protein SOM61_08665 [Massilia sp. CFBP9012]|uniref:Uncharacterized protein n=1 Tax=Massilia aurea TaxID=373040 RepID=A0A422QD27_9BURK|nr:MULTISPECIES: hypothetical protein [Massilia]MDY0975033.1 hypothetical protein [Massilia sp. CFBP9012]RNF27878.1 hypothetical protein NM04_26160 [Massilia aurea]
MTKKSVAAFARKIKAKHLFDAIALILLLIVLITVGTDPARATSLVPIVLSSLLSTFLGASFAFHLNTQKELVKEHEHRVAALQTALFILAQQINAVGGSWVSIAKYEKQPHRWVNMPAMGQPEYKNMQQDFPSLAFILANDPQLLLDLSVEDERFLQCIRSMGERADFYTKEVHEAIEQARAGKTRIDIDELRSRLGDRLFIGAKSRTDDVFLHVSESLKSLPAVASRVRAYAKATYPDEKFLNVELDLGAVDSDKE